MITPVVGVVDHARIVDIAQRDIVLGHLRATAYGEVVILYHRRVAIYVVLPVSVGIYGRIASGVIAPLVDFALREAWSLAVGDETGVLNLHEVGIVGHKIKAFGHSLE